MKFTLEELNVNLDYGKIVGWFNNTIQDNGKTRYAWIEKKDSGLYCYKSNCCNKVGSLDISLNDNS